MNYAFVESTPALWRSAPLWTIATRQERRGEPGAERLSVYRDHGVVPTASRDDNFNKPGEDLATYKVVHPGNLVLNKMKTWQGSLAVSDHYGIVSPAYYVLDLHTGVHPRWLHHLLRSQPYIALYAALSKGIRPNQWDLPFDEFRQIPVLLPPLDEQRRIADFLDTETARLDRLVSLRGRQLAALPIRWRSCLDDAMAALVHRFGAVPLGRSLARIEQGTSPQCDNYPAPDGEWGVLKAGAVKGDRFLPEENKHLPEGLLPEARYEVRAGDLLVTRANTPALVGAAAVVPEDVRPRLILCDKIFRLRLTPNLRPQFVALLSQASVIRDARASAATGTSSSMVNLTNQDVKSWPIPAAPLDVQRILVGELMAVRDSQHRLEEALAAQARLLHERSQALITVAVTGQLDVTTARGGRS